MQIPARGYENLQNKFRNKKQMFTVALYKNHCIFLRNFLFGVAIRTQIKTGLTTVGSNRILTLKSTER